MRKADEHFIPYQRRTLNKTRQRFLADVNTSLSTRSFQMILTIACDSARPPRNECFRCLQSAVYWRDQVWWSQTHDSGMILDANNKHEWKHARRGTRLQVWDGFLAVAIGEDWKEQLPANFHKPTDLTEQFATASYEAALSAPVKIKVKQRIDKPDDSAKNFCLQHIVDNIMPRKKMKFADAKQWKHPPADCFAIEILAINILNAKALPKTPMSQ